MREKIFKSMALAVLLFAFQQSATAQESNQGKQLWAKSVLNEKAPELVVESWISEIPETEGKFVLIDFWATWCGPCRKVIPEMNEWHAKYKDQLTIIGLSDEPVETITAMKEPVIEYYSATDTKKRLKSFLEVKGIPHVMLINPAGNVIWEGFPSLGNHQLKTEILESLLKKYSE